MPPDDDNVEAMVDKWISDTDNGQAAPDSTETPSDDSKNTPPAEGQPPVEAKPDALTGEPATPPGKPADNTQRPAEQVPVKPSPGDLVGQDGRILAKAGAERRHYEAAQRATRDVQQVRTQLERTTAELNAFREAAQLPTQLGLSPEDTTTGLQLISSWKTNPVGVIQYLVEQAKAAGHTLDGIGGMTDPGAIKRMIAEEFAPLREQALQQQSVTQAQTAAKSQIDELVGAYGQEALANSDALAKLITASQEAGQSMSLEQAYSRFSHWCRTRGLDPHQPIDPQLEAKQQPQQAPPATRQSQPPRPNGRSVAAPNGVIPMDTAANVTGSETTRDLVRMAMREQGFNV